MGKWTCKQNKCNMFHRKLSLKTPPTISSMFLCFLDSYPRLVFPQTSKQTYMCFHRMHETTSTAMEAITPIAADRMMATSRATAVLWGYCDQSPHTGRQSEVFSIALQEKPSWHLSVLQLFSEMVEDTKDHHDDTDKQCGSYKPRQPQEWLDNSIMCWTITPFNFKVLI